MADVYEVLTVPRNAPEADEWMGSKPKFWCTIKRESCLFKVGRSHTGEAWAEKAAAELAALLGLPHARVELAMCGGVQGILSYRCLPRENATLIHGNEILGGLPGYPSPTDDRGHQRIPQHTIRLVDTVLSMPRLQPPKGFSLPDGVTPAADIFVGYLLLDAYIGNTDRHHENWAFVLEQRDPHEAPEISLAPTFDHASSLGRELLDQRRKQLLSEHRVPQYVSHCRSAFYHDESDRQPLSTLDAFVEMALLHPQAALAWIDNLARLSEWAVEEVFTRMPPEWLSSTSRAFAFACLHESRGRIMRRRPEFL